jgi:hypothetical protein
VQKLAITRSEPVRNIASKIGDDTRSTLANRSFHSKQQSFSSLFPLSNFAGKNNIYLSIVCSCKQHRSTGAVQMCFCTKITHNYPGSNSF